MSSNAGQPTIEPPVALATDEAQATVKKKGVWSRTLDEFGFQQLVTEYLIPVETNSIWYSLGGVLAISIALEIATGLLLTYVYVPDASLAYGITSGLLSTPGWSIVINFHFYNSFLIFGLVMIHMVRVFITGGYRGGKTGLWLVGVGLAALVFLISITGEALHWDEVGFGVPINMGEVLNAIGLAGFFNYATDSLTTISVATEKLTQLYALHISIIPIVLGVYIAWHVLLIRFKGISIPFWMRASGRTDSFTKHLRSWAIYSAILLGIVLLIAIFLPRDPGVAPQLIPSSPLFGTDEDPGGLGFKPTFPISWTRGMNILAAQFGIDPDIWGTMVVMLVMLGALLAIPFLDRGKFAPISRAEAFDWRKRGPAFVAMSIFWVLLVVGLVVNAVTAEG